METFVFDFEDLELFEINALSEGPANKVRNFCNAGIFTVAFAILEIITLESS